MRKPLRSAGRKLLRVFLNALAANLAILVVVDDPFPYYLHDLAHSIHYTCILHIIFTKDSMNLIASGASLTWGKYSRAKL